MSEQDDARSESVVEPGIEFLSPESETGALSTIPSFLKFCLCKNVVLWKSVLLTAQEIEIPYFSTDQLTAWRIGNASFLHAAMAACLTPVPEAPLEKVRREFHCHGSLSP